MATKTARPVTMKKQQQPPVATNTSNANTSITLSLNLNSTMLQQLGVEPPPKGPASAPQQARPRVQPQGRPSNNGGNATRAQGPRGNKANNGNGNGNSNGNGNGNSNGYGNEQRRQNQGQANGNGNGNGGGRQGQGQRRQSSGGGPNASGYVPPTPSVPRQRAAYAGQSASRAMENANNTSMALAAATGRELVHVPGKGRRA